MTIMGFKKKQCKNDLASWNIKLWKVFSEYIRLRDARLAGMGGYVMCISCGYIKHWKKMDAGHFVPRDSKYLFYNEKNVNAQCGHCNAFMQGNAAGYRIGLDKKYGPGTADELEAVRHYPAGFTIDGLKLKYQEYKAKVAQLKKEIV